MPTELPARTHEKVGALSWIGRGLLALGVISLIALCVLLAVYGPQIRAASDAEDARLLEEENRTFCSRLGVGPETSRYPECAAGLMEIRERHLQRNIRDFSF
jgi:hypothetical protein